MLSYDDMYKLRSLTNPDRTISRKQLRDGLNKALDTIMQLNDRKATLESEVDYLRRKIKKAEAEQGVGSFTAEVLG